ncbi:MAG: septum formation inhibitor Maf [Candidatus Dactylopiibacterium carminicum]|uniref:dTTP/UTP pyrophosphatase n=1 Tax=Candidatus Dactylopiibacterium carminicum TaxID=857335 RepID=A0A272EYZ8_9RHOO|nr:Maf family protein [Candidatus Dactylopiibacterium carminicum]KAF7600832.1 septum formation inhibitor Maf [Candidatus Dactylopiibacterium carminicum]PAS95331.1 MAG: septum formation inhibitor Maf [Candidatus Dactylopiibacterium carminicum]PAS98657.1 MAG: septum formation inhibitor Maf [Candidatus Dactylopiibacterium carminicum]PAT00836.1 MAG: septum formation protein Maf [Candidatus Dactylopiibacterium carminicum]
MASTVLPPRVYLASRSPRRRELLTQIGIEFETLIFRAPPRDDLDVSEEVLPGEDAATYVQRVALAKAEGGLARLRWRSLHYQPVLSADTTLDLDGEIIGKPEDADHARAILRRLSGRSHRVLTAVAVADRERMAHRLSISTVTFRTLSDMDIDHYIASGEPFDKAGAYAIQGRAGAFVREIHGSYSGIVGLPLFETAELLAEFGLGH